MAEKRKQITFDIDTKVAKEVLGEKNYTAAYINIRDFMKSEGWVHIEGSVYMSSKPLSTTKVAHLIKGLKKQYPYLTKCIKTMHQSDISNVHSLSHLFEYDGTPGKFVEVDLKRQEEKTSVLVKLRDKQEEAKIYNSGHNAAQLENKIER